MKKIVVASAFFASGLIAAGSLTSLSAFAQTPAPANSASSQTQTLIQAPDSAPPNQDVPAPLVGQSANIPLGTEAPQAGRSTNIENAIGLDPIPDILRPNAPPRANVPTAPIAPTRPATPQEIAREIAPNFNVSTEYNRLVQCYGTADYLSALMRVRAARPGSTPQIRGLANQITGLKAQMQPFVLAASTVRTEARFRADYDRVARNIGTSVGRAANPDAVIQTHLRAMDGCNRDVRRWRGGR